MLTLHIDIEHFGSFKKESKPCVAWHKCSDMNIKLYKQEKDNKLFQMNPQHDG